MIIALNIALLLVGTTATLAAFGGKTWHEGDSPILKRITLRGWVSLLCLVLALSIGITKEFIASQLARAATEAAENERAKLIARLSQPLGVPTVQLFFRLDCTKKSVEDFCAETKTRANQNAYGSVHWADIDWSSWPRVPAGVYQRSHLDTFIALNFFKSREAATRFLTEGSAVSLRAGDLTLTMELETQPKGETAPSLKAWYNSETDEITIFACSNDPRIEVTSGAILSVPDLANAVMAVVEDGDRLVPYATLDTLQFKTASGFTIDIFDFEEVPLHGTERAFVHYFGTTTALEREPHVGMCE